MFLRFFKSGLPSRFLILLLLALIFRVPELIRFPAKQAVLDVPFHSGLTFLLPLSPQLQWLISFAIFITTALVINKLAIQYSFTGKSSSMAAFFFILGGSVFPVTDPLNIYVLTALLLAVFFAMMFRLQNAHNSIRVAFDSGLSLGVVGLLYPEALFLIITIWLALISYRVGRWRPYIVSILGVITPYFLLFTGYLLFGSPQGFWSAMVARLSPTPGLVHFSTIYSLILSLLFALIVLYSVLKISSSLRSMSINIRQHILVSLWGLLFIFMVLTLFEASADVALLISVPTSLILAAYFEGMKKLKWASLIILTFLILVLANNYLFLFHAS